LSAEEALDLYPYRWSVERIFFDLKEVLNLNCLYTANPNAVAMQVYAAAIVYNALRVAQSDGAAQVGWEPERLSPAKFFPKVATATYLYLHRQQWERELRTRNRRLHLRLVGGRRCWVRAAPEEWRSSPESTTVAAVGSVLHVVTGSRSLTSEEDGDSQSGSSGNRVG
jgi:Transposase DDE domain